MSLVFVPACGFFGLVAWLAVVGFVSWRRTAPLRRGVRKVTLPIDRHAETSRLTGLAGWAGAAASCWGVVLLLDRPVGFPLAVAGVFVTLSAWMARVRYIRTDRVGLEIGFAHRRPRTFGWPDIVALRPPRTPLGGWRVVTREGSATLMPSDLWGNELMLETVASAASLEFDRRSWSRPIRW